MNKPNLRLHPGVLQVPLAIAASLGGGFLLSRGTVSGVASPLAAAVAGVVPPVYAMCILLGALICYAAMGAPAGMHFLLASLLLVTCFRILFRERFKPHMIAFMTAFCGILGGLVLDVVIYGNAGRLPLYGFEAVLIGIASYFIADAADCLRKDRRIILHAGKTFTFALCYLLCVTAVCGLDTPFCNVGRIVGTTLTLLFAKQFRHTGGTLMGALTACGMTLCSVPIGTPMLFLPVTAMMTGFCSQLHNALLIPVFFLLQALSCAVLDSSRELVRVLVELCLACALFAMLSGVDLHRFLSVETPAAAPDHRQAKRLAAALHSLCEETDEVMHRLTIVPPEDGVMQVRAKLCIGCKNQSFCWAQRASQTSGAIRELIRTHHRGLVPEALDGCIRRTSLLEICASQGVRNALSQMQRVHMLQSRQVTLEHLRILEDVTAGLCQKPDRTALSAQTEALRRLLQQCAAKAEDAQVYRLKTGRFAAEILTRQADFPAASIRTLLSQELRETLDITELPGGGQGTRICLYQAPPYKLVWSVQSENAPDYERCGDHFDAFTDGIGDTFLVLSDGMGSGSAASLASRIAVRTFRRMVESGMSVPTAIRLVNSMLLTETSTENFATLDVLHFHADCGELSLYKSGAAATLFCHAGRVQRISSMSFPIGIVTDAMPSQRRTTAFAGDAVVMLSDGIGEAEYPFISSLLREGADPERITQEACRKAAVFQGGQSRDDVTVIAARVVSCLQTVSTKNDIASVGHCVKNTPLSTSKL